MQSFLFLHSHAPFPQETPGQGADAAADAGPVKEEAGQSGRTGKAGSVAGSDEACLPGGAQPVELCPDLVRPIGAPHSPMHPYPMHPSPMHLPPPRTPLQGDFRITPGRAFPYPSLSRLLLKTISASLQSPVCTPQDWPFRIPFDSPVFTPNHFRIPFHPPFFTPNHFRIPFHSPVFTPDHPRQQWRGDQTCCNPSPQAGTWGKRKLSSISMQGPGREMLKVGYPVTSSI